MLIFNPLEWVSGIPCFCFSLGCFLRFGGFVEEPGVAGGVTAKRASGVKTSERRGEG
jgi:hypothetical protein